ncbi:hypothetical protein B0H17DRAFT_1326617 [Mycena rosella]|uniref:Kelch repeat-containing protein n=1 Tax=Mycena rosella TaxID=1033263 RepID=A0AAD7M7C9_MYCRO|nr:hypothetical protein B0H17DRAFT_1326617 [Mycena rosella]
MARGQTPKAQAVAENSPSRTTRESHANAAKVKAERADSAVPAASSKLAVKKLKGDAPPAQPPSAKAIDDENQLLFFNTYDESAKYGSQIYSCDMKTATWTKITKSIKYLSRPLGTPERERQLPSRFGGAMAFYKAKPSGQRMLLLFGGQIDGTDEHFPGAVSNELIAVDLDAAKWWVVDVAGGPVTARVEAQLVVLDDQLFIFGGRTYENSEFRPAEAYCVATLRNQQWTWDVRDAPYPPHVPALGPYCDATSIRAGDASKILLTVGNDKTTHLGPRAFVVFDPALRTFTPHASGSGTFPGNVTWFHIYEVPGSVKPNAAAVLCAFHAEDAQLPELYVYSLPPHAGCAALGLRKRIAEAKKTFELFAVVGASMYLLGSTKDRWDIFAEVPMRWISG